MTKSLKTTLGVRLDGFTIVVTRGGNDPHIERWDLDRAPFLVEQLLGKGLHITARSVADAWFVGLAARNGLTQYQLADGSRNGQF